MNSPIESAVNLISEGSAIEGIVSLDHTSRIHGVVKGEVRAKDGSTLILCESAYVEGTLNVDSIIVDGFVRGDIHARTKVLISGTGRVVGNVHSPNLQIDFGAYFEGNCSSTRPTLDPSPKPA